MKIKKRRLKIDEKPGMRCMQLSFHSIVSHSFIFNCENCLVRNESRKKTNTSNSLVHVFKLKLCGFIARVKRLNTKPGNVKERERMKNYYRFFLPAARVFEYYLFAFGIKIEKTHTRIHTYTHIQSKGKTTRRGNKLTWVVFARWEFIFVIHCCWWRWRWWRCCCYCFRVFFLHRHNQRSDHFERCVFQDSTFFSHCLFQLSSAHSRGLPCRSLLTNN